MSRQARLHRYLDIAAAPSTDMPLDEVVYARRIVTIPEVKEQPVPAVDAQRLADIISRLKTLEESRITVTVAPEEKEKEAPEPQVVEPDKHENSLVDKYLEKV